MSLTSPAAIGNEFNLMSNDVLCARQSLEKGDYLSAMSNLGSAEIWLQKYRGELSAVLTESSSHPIAVGYELNGEHATSFIRPHQLQQCHYRGEKYTIKLLNTNREEVEEVEYSVGEGLAKGGDLKPCLEFEAGRWEEFSLQITERAAHYSANRNELVAALVECRGQGLRLGPTPGGKSPSDGMSDEEQIHASILDLRNAIAGCCMEYNFADAPALFSPENEVFLHPIVQKMRAATIKVIGAEYTMDPQSPEVE